MNYTLHDAIAELKRLSQGKTNRVPLPDDRLISEYEQDIGFKFSDDFKLFLKEASNVFFGTKDPLVITSGKTSRGELSSAIEQGRLIGLPHDWLPICEDNGDYYCIVASGQIRFWSGNGPSDESWPDLATWIKKVWIEEG